MGSCFLALDLASRMSISKLDVVPGAVGTNLIPFGSLEGEAHGYNNNFLASRLAAGVVRDRRRNLLEFGGPVADAEGFDSSCASRA